MCNPVVRVRIHAHEEVSSSFPGRLGCVTGSKILHFENTENILYCYLEWEPIY